MDHNFCPLEFVFQKEETMIKTERYSVQSSDFWYSSMELPRPLYAKSNKMECHQDASSVIYNAKLKGQRNQVLKCGWSFDLLNQGPLIWGKKIGRCPSILNSKGNCVWKKSFQTPGTAVPSLYTPCRLLSPSLELDLQPPCLLLPHHQDYALPLL